MPCCGGWSKTGLSGFLPVSYDFSDGNAWRETTGRTVVAVIESAVPYAHWFLAPDSKSEEYVDALVGELCKLASFSERVAVLGSRGFAELIPPN